MRLSNLENLRHLSVWLDAASQWSRNILIRCDEAFDFDERLVPFLRASIPLSQADNGRYYPEVFKPRQCVFARGHAQFWQSPSAAPNITWSENYRHAEMYITAEDIRRRPRILIQPVRRIDLTASEQVRRWTSRQVRRWTSRGAG